MFEHDLRRGDFLLSSPYEPRFYSRLIRLVTRSQWTHAALYMGDETVAEALDGGMTISPISRFDGDYRIGLCRIPGATDEDRESMASVMDGFVLVNTGYGWVDVCMVALRRWGIPVPRFGRRRLFCSEAVVLAAAGGGHLNITELDPGDTTPGDLAVFIYRTIETRGIPWTRRS